MAGEALGTVFRAKAKPLGDRKWWIKHGLQVQGRLVVDDGALAGIQGRGSLFAAGVTRVEGSFVAQTAVAIVSASTGREVARGLANYASTEVERIRGCKSSEIEARLGYIEADCVVHRHNLVLLTPTPPRP
jgi:glutamate 5-kinase